MHIKSYNHHMEDTIIKDPEKTTDNKIAMLFYYSETKKSH